MQAACAAGTRPRRAAAAAPPRLREHPAQPEKFVPARQTRSIYEGRRRRRRPARAYRSRGRAARAEAAPAPVAPAPAPPPPAEKKEEKRKRDDETPEERKARKLRVPAEEGQEERPCCDMCLLTTLSSTAGDRRDERSRPGAPRLVGRRFYRWLMASGSRACSPTATARDGLPQRRVLRPRQLRLPLADAGGGRPTRRDDLDLYGVAGHPLGDDHFIRASRALRRLQGFVRLAARQARRGPN